MSEFSPALPADALNALALFPLPNAVLFPGVGMSLHVFEPRYREMIADVLNGSRALGIAHLKPGFEHEYQGRPPIFEVCGAGRIEDYELLEDGKYNLLVRGVLRVRVVRELPPLRAYRQAQCERLADPDCDRRTLSAWQQELERSWQRLTPYLPERLRGLGQLGDSEVSAWADRIAAAVLADPAERQALLEELDPADRLGRLVQLLHELGTALNAHTIPPSSQLN